MPTAKLDQEAIEGRLTKHIDRIEQHLDASDTLGAKLDKAGIKDTFIALGILYDKLLGLKGKPTHIVSLADHHKLDELAPALLAEIQRRGLTAKLTERTAEIRATPVDPTAPSRL